MKLLFIGGTGTISSAITKAVCEQGHELYLVNRGLRNKEQLPGVTQLICDVNQEEEFAKAIAPYQFDVVADFIAFQTNDYREVLYRQGELRPSLVFKNGIPHQLTTNR